jgi:hypothetical protein
VQAAKSAKPVTSLTRISCFVFHDSVLLDEATNTNEKRMISTNTDGKQRMMSTKLEVVFQFLVLFG